MDTNLPPIKFKLSLLLKIIFTMSCLLILVTYQMNPFGPFISRDDGSIEHYTWYGPLFYNAVNAAHMLIAISIWLPPKVWNSYRWLTIVPLVFLATYNAVNIIFNQFKFALMHKEVSSLTLSDTVAEFINLLSIGGITYILCVLYICIKLIRK